MRLLVISAITGWLVLFSCSEASAFGRGGGGGAPPHGGGGGGVHFSGGGAHFSGGGGAYYGGHGAAGGAFGGAHGYSAPHFSGFEHWAGTPGAAFVHPGGITGGAVVHPQGITGGAVVHPGGTVGGGVRPAGGAVIGGERGGVVGREAGGIVGGAGREGGFNAGGYRGGTAIGGVGGYSGVGTHYLSSSTLHGIGRSIRGENGGYGGYGGYGGGYRGYGGGYGGYGRGHGGYGGYGLFAGDWFGRHRGGWFPGLWWGGLGFWGLPVWDTLAPYVGIAGPPIDYDYGSTAVLSDGTMYLNGDPLGSEQDYAAQAIALDDTGRAATPGPGDQWQPLGVFGLIQGDEKAALRIIQLAVNKAGVVRGNYYDAVADTTQPIYGEVDPKSQRVVWSMGDRKDIVFEAGLNNLLQNESTVLIHYGKDKTEQLVLVRLPGPTQGQPPQPPPTLGQPPQQPQPQGQPPQLAQPPKP